MRDMGVEIERKFLVVDDGWRAAVQTETHIVQGYLHSGEKATVRVRIAGERAFLTIKGRTKGISRSEFEYEIPVTDAELMVEDLVSGPVIDKVRHVVDEGGRHWEVDVFAGDNEGLVMAEIEIDAEDDEVAVPSWAGLEVSDDARYFNANLARDPFRNWGLDG